MFHPPHGEEKKRKIIDSDETYRSMEAHLYAVGTVVVVMVMVVV